MTIPLSPHFPDAPDFRDPLSFLGLHPGGGAAGADILRVYRPRARAVAVEWCHGQKMPLSPVGQTGLFVWQGQLPGRPEAGRGEYVLWLDEGDGMRPLRDPYAFPPRRAATAEDRFLLVEGRQCLGYRLLGALPEIRQDDGDGTAEGEACCWVPGVCFRVCLPGASWVALVGPFNHWDTRWHRMIPLGEDGIWELFLPQLPAGTPYRFACSFHADEAAQIVMVEDPWARQAGVVPASASGMAHCARVAAESEYDWRDGAWLGRRSMLRRPPAMPSIYRVAQADWPLPAGDAPAEVRELAAWLCAQARQAAATHVALPEPAGRFLVNPLHGSAEGLRGLVDACHQQGLGLLMPWSWATSPADGDFLDTSQTKSLLLSSIRYWLDEFHLDGLFVSGLERGRRGLEGQEAQQFFQAAHTLMQREFPGTLSVVDASPGRAMPETASLVAPVHQGGWGFSLCWSVEGSDTPR
ncbi:MAG: hypothetical protein KBD39_09985 [Sterolibacterium sp.]|nr:hypothetical protein [Sterolibacterium sp.]MBP9800431.1 hypothetical protein [Sterolibacterium sp.]